MILKQKTNKLKLYFLNFHDEYDYPFENMMLEVNVAMGIIGDVK